MLYRLSGDSRGQQAQISFCTIYRQNKQRNDKCSKYYYSIFYYTNWYRLMFYVQKKLESLQKQGDLAVRWPVTVQAGYRFYYLSVVNITIVKNTTVSMPIPPSTRCSKR